MSSTIQAKRLQICIFTLKDATYDDQPADVRAMYDAFAAPVIDIQNQHNSAAPVSLDICPISYNENLQIIEKQGLDLSRLPAAQVAAQYPDGSTRVYFLKSGLGAINFTAETVKPYIETLLYNRTAQEKPIICKIFPPACEIGGWLWLGLAVYGVYRTTQARNIGKVLWGSASLLAVDAFVKGGGVDMLKKTLGK